LSSLLSFSRFRTLTNDLAAADAALWTAQSAAAHARDRTIAARYHAYSSGVTAAMTNWTATISATRMSLPSSRSEGC